ncbi:MAG TPA: FGGY family carbohydrate kinase [Rectinemataceae bacterium]|nr:FGGY family carbohydrate kinase [Rectinemataceae bacterium]
MVVAIDIGTTSAKAALFDREGGCVAVERATIRGIIGANPVEHEIDPRSWTEAVEGLLAGLAAAVRGGLADVECVVVSGNGPTLLPVDAEGEPLHNAITWMDRRAAEESALAEPILGRFLDPAYNLPKVLWLKAQRPDIYENTRWFSSCPEYIIARLCGAWISILPAEGYQAIIWDSRSLRLLGLDEGKFPPFAKLGSIVGAMTRQAAEATGLPEGIPVVAGGPDFIVSLIGTATTSPRRACDRSGTSEGINLCWNTAVPRDPRLLFMPHVIEPYENISGVISATGRAVSWFMGIEGVGAGDHGDFFRMAAEAPAGADNLLFLPYLSGERAPLWNPDARAVFVGLSLRHGRKEMARAVAESAGFAMRDVIEVMESLGTRVEDLRVTGQPAGNAIWNQIKADITRKPILVPSFGEAELLGDLCLALVALGQFPTIGQAAEKLVSFGKTFFPDESKKALYDELFSLYRESYKGLEPVFHRLAKL